MAVNPFCEDSSMENVLLLTKKNYIFAFEILT